MTGGSFTASDASSTVTSQPRSPSIHTTSRRGSDIRGKSAAGVPFDDAHCERSWSTGLCGCGKDKRRNCCCNYMLATRLGETPFMAMIPCATFALRIKVRTLFGIKVVKGSLVGDFWTTLCCEPCAVCQMTRELDDIGL
ncbi:hypothetical protein KUTeg_002574 [Tegillarca granosa]|uniref:Cornifelin n=1 Tax=Tegillarca granosa TaxID=220873 RepID=A0ABQ9FW14_TEGGR|nr:hypothetical protein KUTeg_002574 [Tegillarca granosa]